MKRVIGVKVMVALILIFLGTTVLTLTESTLEAGQRFAFKEQTVEDLRTGLFWTRNANVVDSQMNWYDAAEFVKKLNKKKFAGYSDWRLPDIDELHNLAAAVKQTSGTVAFTGDTTIASVMEKMGFKNVQSSDYWTSTSSLFVETEAWYYSLAYGSRAMGSKWLYRYVWPMRWESRKVYPPYSGNGANHDKKDDVSQTR